jgi:predicted AAA+ superfamily ATPase
MTVIERPDYIEQIMPFMNKDLVKVLKGIRRCGKSTILRILRNYLIQDGVEPQNTVLHNFDSLKAKKFTDYQECYDYFANFANENDNTTYFFFDEIQELDGWEKMVNSLMLDYNCDIYVTGSNSKLLSTEFATYLGGRYVSFDIFPLSYREIKQYNPDATFEYYLKTGGMPYLQFAKADETFTEKYLQDIYDSIILKDITLRYEVRNVELLRRMTTYFISSVGHTFSPKNLSNVLKNEGRSVSPETVYNFLNYCEGANLIRLVSRENITGKNVLRSAEKIYVTDHGLREAIYGNNHRDRNQVLENIVYFELLRRGYEVTVGEIGKNEVDFIARKSNKTKYFQVSWTIAAPETQEREMRSLLAIGDNFDKYIISTDNFDYSAEGIIHRNCEDWLLDES